MVILIQDFGIDSVKFFPWKQSKKLPAFIQGLSDTSVFCLRLAYKFTLKGFAKYQISFIQRRELIFTDNRGKGSGISNLGIAGEELVGYILMVCSCVALTNAVLHQTGKRRQYIDRRIDCLSMELAV